MTLFFFLRYPRDAQIVELLTLHKISNGNFQSCATTIDHNFSFSVLKAYLHSSLTSNVLSFLRRSKSGLEIFEKSIMNLL